MLTEPDNVDKLVEALAHPIFNYRMSQHPESFVDPTLRKGAETRMKKAKEEIRDAVTNYIADEYPDAQLDG